MLVHDRMHGLAQIFHTLTSSVFCFHFIAHPHDVKILVFYTFP